MQQFHDGKYHCLFYHYCILQLNHELDHAQLFSIGLSQFQFETQFHETLHKPLEAQLDKLISAPSDHIPVSNHNGMNKFHDESLKLMDQHILLGKLGQFCLHFSAL